VRWGVEWVPWSKEQEQVEEQDLQVEVEKACARVNRGAVERE